LKARDANSNRIFPADHPETRPIKIECRENRPSLPPLSPGAGRPFHLSSITKADKVFAMTRSKIPDAIGLAGDKNSRSYPTGWRPVSGLRT